MLNNPDVMSRKEVIAAVFADGKDASFQGHTGVKYPAHTLSNPVGRYLVAGNIVEKDVLLGLYQLPHEHTPVVDKVLMLIREYVYGGHYLVNTNVSKWHEVRMAIPSASTLTEEAVAHDTITYHALFNKSKGGGYPAVSLATFPQWLQEIALQLQRHYDKTFGDQCTAKPTVDAEELGQNAPKKTTHPCNGDPLQQSPEQVSDILKGLVRPPVRKSRPHHLRADLHLTGVYLMFGQMVTYLRGIQISDGYVINTLFASGGKVVPPSIMSVYAIEVLMTRLGDSSATVVSTYPGFPLNLPKELSEVIQWAVTVYDQHPLPRLLTAIEVARSVGLGAARVHHTLDVNAAIPNAVTMHTHDHDLSVLTFGIQQRDPSLTRGIGDMYYRVTPGNHPPTLSSALGLPDSRKGFLIDESTLYATLYHRSPFLSKDIIRALLSSTKDKLTMKWCPVDEIYLFEDHFITIGGLRVLNEHRKMLATLRFVGTDPCFTVPTRTYATLGWGGAPIQVYVNDEIGARWYSIGTPR